MNLRHDQTSQCGTSVRRLAAYYRRHKLGPPPPAEAPPARNYVLSFASSSAYAMATPMFGVSCARSTGRRALADHARTRRGSC